MKKTLYQRLNSLFAEDEQLKNKCTVDNKNSETRILNDFPCLLSSLELNCFVAHMRFILQNMFIEKDNNKIEMSDGDKKKLLRLENKLIELAARQLLNANKEIKPEVLNFMQWQNEIDPSDLVCSYVCMSHAYIFDQLQDEMPHYENQFTATFAYLKNYRKWVEEALINLRYGYKTVVEEKIENRDENKLSVSLR